MKVFTKLSLLLAMGMLVGCAPQMVKEDVRKEIEEARVAPEQAPQRNITGFSDGLRCMDNMMIQYGVRDVVVLVEDLQDNTGKVQAGTKDMLISAVSDMTRRSRAVRLIAYGNDSGNLVSFVAAAGKQNIYNVVPQYDIRGSISQLDSSVVREQADAGFGAKNFGIGGSTSAAGSILGIDLSVISTEDLSLIPGVVSRNSVVIYKSGSALDADASIKKAGINFSILFSKSEGQSQALRNLVELATIELFGKLLKVPYWQCLGVDPQHEEVRNEITDWYYSMTAHGEMVPYVQKLLRQRGFYKGPADGYANADYAGALASYRAGLGMSAGGQVDMAFFDALLNREAPPVRVASVSTPSLGQGGGGSLKVDIRTGKSGSTFSRGEPISLSVATDRDAYLYCYFHDEGGNVQRFFPNRFHQDAFVKAGSAMRIPGSMPFRISASDSGAREHLACFATPSDVSTALPESVRKTDFENLNVASLQVVEQIFREVSGQSVGADYLRIDVRR